MTTEDDGTRRFSLENLKEQRRKRKTETSSEPPAVAIDAKFWASARVVVPPAKASVHLRLDADVLDWFRGQGKGHLTRMNAVLRSFMDAHKPDRF